MSLANRLVGSKNDPSARRLFFTGLRLRLELLIEDSPLIDFEQGLRPLNDGLFYTSDESRLLF